MTDYGRQPIQHLQHSSPLDSLVRRTSSRRRPPASLSANSRLGESSSHAEAAVIDHDAAYTAQTSTPPRRRQGRPPSSPLLHTQFRSSTATTATTLDLLNKSSSSIAGDDSQDIYYNDADSIYSSATVSPQYRAGMHPTPPRSADSRYNPEPSAGRAAHQGRQPGDPFVGIPSMYTDYRPSLDGYRPAETRPQEQEQEYGRPRRSSDSQHVDPFAFTGMPQADSSRSVPTVVISSADTSDTRSLAASYVTPSLSSSGRTPSALPYGVNYSRPVRPSSDDNKRMVLERNGYRTPPTTGASGARTFQSMQAAPPLDPHSASRSGPTPLSRVRSPLASPSPTAGPQEPSFAAPTSRSPSPRSPLSEPAPTSPLSPASTNFSLTQTITLSRDPPPPPTSPTGSLYSSYSYYQLETPVPSPTTDTLRVPGAPPAPPAPSPPRTALAPAPNTVNPRTAEDYLQLGIQHHEANRLAESAACFEQSATLPGGSGVGMLMWGLALRHGWGCAKNERQGFAWLRRAAESAVDDLERARQGMDTTAIRSELVLAIYEVGQCFFQGWGVKKDQKMAVSYFQVAAKLGDADAQQELAFCLANGKGCKKDRKEAAKWYRDAVAQGASDVGLAWIYKEKFK